MPRDFKVLTPLSHNTLNREHTEGDRARIIRFAPIRATSFGRTQIGPLGSLSSIVDIAWSTFPPWPKFDWVALATLANKNAVRSTDRNEPSIATRPMSLADRPSRS
jgi:hypothetical protein